MNANDLPPEVLFFVRIRGSGAGHHLKSKRTLRVDLRDTPWGNGIDTGLLKAAGIPDRADGTFVCVQKDGWTALSFWDNSGDSRGNSNSAFLIRALVTDDELLLAAKEQWPELFKQPGWPLKEIKAFTRQELIDGLEIAWGLIANASSGDWSKETDEWQEAAAKWRDGVYHKLLNSL